MNKELETLAKMRQQLKSESNRYDFHIELDLIENALEDYDNIKHICNFYNIEFNLPNIREAVFTFAQLKGEYGANWDNYNNKLKALEIIEKKKVNVQELFDFIKEYGKHNGLYMYNGHRPYEKRINEEEFDLLKKELLFKDESVCN